MISKTVFIVLIGCALAFASPIKRDDSHEDWSSEESVEIGSEVKEPIKHLFGELLDKIGGAIKDCLQDTFDQLGERLNTKDYKDAVEDLAKTLQKIADANARLENDKKTKEYLEDEAEKVGETFAELIQEAAEDIKKHKEGTVNAKKFHKAVHQLKKIVDEIL